MARLIEKPTTIMAAGNKPKQIDEFIGRVNSGTEDVSIAHMLSPADWIEPGQCPAFDEYTVVAIVVYAAKGHVLWIPGICLALGNSSGAWIGTHVAIKKGQRFIQIVFNIAVIGLVLKLLVG